MGIQYETREVDLKNKPQSLLSFSPKGTVPVLIMPNGKILEESLDIILWAMPKPEDKDQIDIDEIISVNDNDFKADNHQYKYGEDSEYFRKKCESFIWFLDQKLSKHTYLISDEISIADIAVFPLVRQFSMVDNSWFMQTPYKNVQRWLNDISASDFFAKAMQKLPAIKVVD